jgi:methanethiol S-methyltransferase
MLYQHFILIFLWIVYCVTHSILASLQVKHIFKKIMKADFKYYRFIYTIFALAGLTALVIYQLRITTPVLFKKIPFVQIIGSVISLAGLSIMSLCVFNYFNSVSGVRWLTDNQYESKLVLKNIHKRVRHPLYMGTFLFIWGLLLIFPLFSLLVTNSIITIYTLIGIRLEEKKLVSEFGENYKTYQQTVPKIIPRFKKLPHSLRTKKLFKTSGR